MPNAAAPARRRSPTAAHVAAARRRARRRPPSRPEHVEHPLAAGLRGVVGGGAQKPVRQREFGDRPPRLRILRGQRAAGVGQVVLVAQSADPYRDLREPVAGKIRVEVVLDLVGQVAGHEPQHRSGVDVGTAQHLAQIPLTAALVGHIGCGELLGAVREVPAEDHRVGPEVADDIGQQVGLDRAREARRRRQGSQRRVGEEVLGQLPHGLGPQFSRPGHGGRAGIGVAKLAEFQVLQGDSPLETGGEDQVQERVDEVGRHPLLISGDAQHPVADVIVHIQNVGVLVVHVVVGVPPVLGHPGHIPLPGRRVDLRIVHPVPLAVDDVVADLHVLDDLGDRQGQRPGPPRTALVAERQQ